MGQALFNFLMTEPTIQITLSHTVIMRFSKETHYQVNFKEKKIMKDFNAGLKHLRKTGRYQQLIDNYIH